MRKYLLALVLLASLTQGGCAHLSDAIANILVAYSQREYNLPASGNSLVNSALVGLDHGLAERERQKREQEIVNANNCKLVDEGRVVTGILCLEE